MTADPKLIEAVEDALCRADDGAAVDYRKQAIAALSAINASGTHWVAPWQVPDQMADDLYASSGAVDEAWAEVRTAYLAKTEETKL